MSRYVHTQEQCLISHFKQYSVYHEVRESSTMRSHVVAETTAPPKRENKECSDGVVKSTPSPPCVRTDNKETLIEC